MRKPKTTIPTELHRAWSRQLATLEAYGDQEKTEDEVDDFLLHPSEPLFRLDGIKLPEGVRLEDCYIAVFNDDNGYTNVRLMYDGPENPNYENQMKEYEAWLIEQERQTKERRRLEKQQLENQIRWAKEQLTQLESEK